MLAIPGAAPVRAHLSSHQTRAAGADPWPDLAARLYAQALDRSDYAGQVGAILQRHLGVAAGLLDIGAGGGHIGRAWLPPGTPWTALEPNRYLRARLGRVSRTGWPSLRVIDATWQDLPHLGLRRHDVVLGANLSGPLNDAVRFLAACLGHAAGAVAWVVPAQQPRRLCLSAALPAALHGEAAGSTGLDMVLDALGPRRAPRSVETFTWTYRGRFRDLGAAADHLAAALGWLATDPRRPALAAHLAEHAVVVADGVEIAAPKRSAVLVWSAA